MLQATYIFYTPATTHEIRVITIMHVYITLVSTHVLEAIVCNSIPYHDMECQLKLPAKHYTLHDSKLATYVHTKSSYIVTCVKSYQIYSSN